MTFTIGDIERQYDTDRVIARLNYTDKQRLKLNKMYNANFSMTEWISFVLYNTGKYDIVCFSEIDNKEYDVSNLFSAREITKILKVMSEY